MYRFAACITLFCISCTAPTRLVSYTSRTVPIYAVDPPPQKIILLNTYNIAEKKYRDNKEELFGQLIDTMMHWAATRIHDNAGIQTEVMRGYTAIAGNKDSTIAAIITTHNATHAIAVNSFDVYFNQTHVEVTKTNSGKDREAYYDIVTDISYALYGKAKMIREKDIHQSRFHSSRNVVSGLLAAGPNVVSKKEDAYRITMQTWEEYLNYFFPGEKLHHRPVFSGKEFEAVGKAISRQDYETAMIESLRFIDDPDKQKAAKANYNCAVFMERKSQHEEAKKYLSRSLSLATLSEAKQMWNDFE